MNKGNVWVTKRILETIQTVSDMSHCPIVEEEMSQCYVISKIGSATICQQWTASPSCRHSVVQLANRAIHGLEAKRVALTRALVVQSCKWRSDPCSHGIGSQH